ncbi:MAG: thioredoxin family protein [Clostridiales bacterium]|jgi:thioredoxin 1|nr:thioredoxin family protein [Clostridiales bacterium]
MDNEENTCECGAAEDGHHHRKSTGKNLVVAVVLLLIAVGGIWFYKQANSVSIKDFDVTESFDLAALKASGLPSVLMFGEDNCPVCEEMLPRISQLRREYQGKLTVQYVDALKNRAAGEGFFITLLPTIYFFDDKGEIKDSSIGSIDLDGLREKVKMIL